MRTHQEKKLAYLWNAIVRIWISSSQESAKIYRASIWLVKFQFMQTKITHCSLIWVIEWNEMRYAVDHLEYVHMPPSPPFFLHANVSMPTTNERLKMVRHMKRSGRYTLACLFSIYIKLIFSDKAAAATTSAHAEKTTLCNNRFILLQIRRKFGKSNRIGERER